MSDERKQLKVGVRVGKGVPPGYKWNVGVLDFAHREALSILNNGQRRHLALQVRELASQDEVSVSDTLDLRPIGEDIFEIRDYGGILGGLNIRLFFGVDHPRRCLIVLGIFKKQNNGPTPPGDLVRNQRRWRLYKSGEFGSMDC